MKFVDLTCLVRQPKKRPLQRYGLLLLWSLWLVMLPQGPLWAQSLNSEPRSAWSVSLEPEEQILLARLGNGSESLPDSALVPPRWYWTMSFLVPGISQMLMDEPEHGLFFFIGTAASIALVPVTVGAFTTQNQPEGANLMAANILSWVFAAITAGFYVGNLLDAYFLNQDKVNAAETAALLKHNLFETGLNVNLHHQGIVSLDYALTRF